MGLWRIFRCGTVLLVALAAGCGKNDVDQALDSDANGYLCLACETKFYTERDVFATRCPKCQKNTVEQVLGFVCEADRHMTMDARGRGARVCGKCGKLTTAIAIPREADLKSWGAEKKMASETGG